MNSDIAYLSQLREDLQRAAQRGGVRHHNVSRRMIAAGALVGVLTLAGVVGTVVPRLTQRAPLSNSFSAIQPATKAAPAPSPAGGAPPRDAYGAGSSGGAGTTDAAALAARGAIDGAAGSATEPGFGPKIVKTAHMDLQVARGTFERSFGDASQVAADNGGFVVSSSSGGADARYGSLVLRVPAGRFEAALASLRSIGVVKWQSVNGRDVTAAYVDLSARIRTWRSQELVLFRLMDHASTIGETLQVQSHLQRVQLTIEELEGQLRLLRNQAAFGTISLSIRETGIRPATQGPAATTPTMLRAWRGAVGGFLSVVAAIVVGLGYLIPIALVCLLGWIVTRQVRKLASA
ncbi:MAG TPA: DUF4349 domain-containing protein [Actinomycetota bacterium]|nr:DUF4349 domain-containing protein [Actinomycetota bacterium]